MAKIPDEIRKKYEADRKYWREYFLAKYPNRGLEKVLTYEDWREWVQNVQPPEIKTQHDMFDFWRARESDESLDRWEREPEKVPGPPPRKLGETNLATSLIGAPMALLHSKLQFNKEVKFATAALNRPPLTFTYSMHHAFWKDEDYQSIVAEIRSEKLTEWTRENKKHWSEHTKDEKFMAYIKGDSEDPDAPNIYKDAAEKFRTDERYKEKAQRYYEEERKRIYYDKKNKNLLDPSQDPIYHEYQTRMHLAVQQELARAKEQRKKGIKTKNDYEIKRTIEYQHTANFLNQFPEKARTYAAKRDPYLKGKLYFLDNAYKKMQKQKRAAVAVIPPTPASTTPIASKPPLPPSAPKPPSGATFSARKQGIIDKFNQLFARLQRENERERRHAEAISVHQPPRVSHAPRRRGGFMTRGINSINKMKTLSKFARMGRTGVTVVRGASTIAAAESNPVGWVATIVAIVLIIVLAIAVDATTPHTVRAKPAPPGSSSSVPPPGSGSTSSTNPIPGLSINVSPSTVQVTAGSPINYTITVDYSGPLDVTAHAPLPPDTTYASSNPSGTYNAGTNEITWRLKDFTPSGSTYSFSVTLTPNIPDMNAAVSAYATAPGGFIAGGSGNACTQKYEGTGYCSVQNLKQFFGDNVNALIASMVCQSESQSNPLKLNDNCSTNDYSVGLFQINAVAHCPGAYARLSCQNLIDSNARATCTQTWKDPVENIKWAVQNFNSKGWADWEVWAHAGFIGISVKDALTKCGISY